MKKRQISGHRLNITLVEPNNAKKMPVSFSIQKRSIVIFVVLICGMLIAMIYSSVSSWVSLDAVYHERMNLQTALIVQTDALRNSEDAIARLEQENSEYEGAILSQNQKAQLNDIYIKELEQGTRKLREKFNKLLAESTKYNTEAVVRISESSGSGRILSSESITFESGSVNGIVEIINWFDGGSKSFPKTTIATIIDVETGRSFQAIRFGGTYHADCEPLTEADTAVMKDICGGQWTWDRRAIWVKIDDRYFAASRHSMPHMVDIVPGNNFGGHFCIHYLHSKVHETSAECPEHQAMVQKAFTNAGLLNEYQKKNQYE